MNSVPEVFFVISSLEPSGPARQLVHLAAGLPRDRFAVRVCVLGRHTPWCDDLVAAGAHVDVLGWHRPIDCLGVLNPIHVLNRKLGTARTEVIHALGLGAAWAVVLGRLCPLRRLRISAALPSGGPSWPSRLLLRRAGRVLALGEADAEAYRGLGVLPSRLAVVAPGVPVPETQPAPARLPGVPDSARVILCLGPIERHKGHRDAAWAVDILRLVHPEAHLVVLGRGPAIDAVVRLVRSNQLGDCVHLPGRVADVGPWLARAEVVWVPSLGPGGRFAVLEAMAAGRPVVASRLPVLTELVVEAQTGYLVRPGDKVELARQTRVLLDHPDVAQQMGAAGRQRVREYFDLGAFQARVAAWLESA
jgi:glycosyltransferase involved in cell wall biosynthesis